MHDVDASQPSTPEDARAPDGHDLHDFTSCYTEPGRVTMASPRGELVNKTFRLRSEWVRRAEKRAIDDNRSLTDVVEEALERYGAPHEGDTPRLIANARQRIGARRRQFGGRFPEHGPLTRDETYER